MPAITLITLTLVCIVVQVASADYAADETSIINEITSNYSVDARPENVTRVLTIVGVFALNTVDIGSEYMSLTGYVVNQWRDPRLTWDSTATGIKQIVIKPKHIWTPPIVIENEIDEVGILGKDGVPLRVTSDGIVGWTPPVTTSTSCSADITYYPYDKQTCTLTLTGWSYTVNEVNLTTIESDPIDRTYYVRHGEWDLLSTDVAIQNLGEEPDVFRKLHFKFTFRRKWAYYGQNVILPIVLNSFLMALVFAVPIESGEKMGYCLTVLLTFIVLLTMVSDDLPPISNQTSIVQMYLSIVMCVGTASTVSTIGVLRVYNHNESDPVPGWLQKLTKYLIAPLTCRGCKSNRVSSLGIQDGKKTGKGGSLEEEYTHKEIAVLLDRFFFLLHAVGLFVMTTCFLGILLAHYNDE